MKQTFYSNGKLLITGEYVVLDGALAMALPTKFGQFLEVETNDSNQISWKSFDSDQSCWFETVLTVNDIKNKTNFDDKIKLTLVEILHEADKLNPKFLEKFTGFVVETKLNFPRNWGLGTSSTLINNIAQWFQIDAFDLLKNSFGGSGYDIACAQNNSPILYQLLNENPIITKVEFNPKFKENLYFLYLNQKQNSKTAIANYKKNTFDKSKVIEKINQLTQTIATTIDFLVFESAISQHETEMSLILNQVTIQQQLFPDFEGTIKSLGAWGGDFIMVISHQNPTDYFKQKGFETILTYDDMIL